MENLYKTTKTNLNIPNTTFAYVIKQGNICFLEIDSGKAFFSKKENDVLFTLPQNLIPQSVIAFAVNAFSTKNFLSAKIYENGICKMLNSVTFEDSFYISISYVCSNFN